MIVAAYIAPEGDNTVIEYFGQTFVSGEAVIVENERAIAKIRNHPLFVVQEEAEEPVTEEPKRRGRPPKMKDEAGE